MASTAIDLSFRADISNLTKSLATLPGLTEKEAKAMVKSLESNIKKAEKAAVKSAAAAGKAWQGAGKNMKGGANSAKELTASLDGLQHSTGEADSIMKALGGAIGTVSPQAERALSTLGDLSGGIEAVARSGMGLAGPVALVSAAIAVGAFAWKSYSEDLAEAEDRMKAAAAASAELAATVGQMKTTEARAQLELAVALGEEEIGVLHRAKAADRARAAMKGTLTAANKSLLVAQKEYNQAVREESEALRAWKEDTGGNAAIHFAARKELERSTKVLGVRRGEVDAVTEREARLADTFDRARAANAKNTKAHSRATKTIKAEKDAIQELIDTSRAMIPAEQLSKLQALSNQIDVVTDAIQEAGTAGSRLEPVLAELEDGFDRIDAEQVAEGLDKIAQEAAQMTQVADPIQDAAELLERLQTAASSSAEAASRLAPEIAAVSKHMKGLQSAGVAAITVIASDATLKETREALRGLEADWAAAGSAQDDYVAANGTASESIAANMDSLAKAIEAGQESMKQKILAAFATMTQAAATFAQAGANFAALATNKIVAAAEDEAEERSAIKAALESDLAEIESDLASATTDKQRAALEAEKLLIQEGLAAEEEKTAKLKALKQREITEAFRNQQKFQIAVTAMNTATAIMQAWASMPPPAAAVMTAAIIALGASQVATIAAQEPPSAHMGGLISGRTNSDERMIKARSGEGVLTAQGVQAIGGAQGLADANAGVGGGSQPLVIQQVYKHRVLDTILADSIQRGGPISAAMNKRTRRGRRNPYRRSA